MKASPFALLLLFSAAVDAVCPPPFDAANRDPSGAASETDLLAAIAALGGHITSGTYDAVQIDADRAQFVANSARLTFNLTTIQAALDLVDLYEAEKGALFINPKSVDKGVNRTYLMDDGKELERAILAVQQATLDEVYHGSYWHSRHRSDPRDRADSPIVQACVAELSGRKWLTSNYYPGAVAPPADPSVVHTVQVNATFSTRWGRRVAFTDDVHDNDLCCDGGNNFFRAIRPLGGLYLSPGEIAEVTVPAALVGTNYTIQVGGSSIDNSNKGTHRRMDRITTTYPIESSSVHVANPLGGGVYLRMPYPSSAGVISIAVTGGVVQAPRFALTSIEQTNEAEWNALRAEPGPWVDFESDVFLMTVPRMWVYEYSYAHVHALLTNYTNIMNGITELVGIPPERRNNYVLYITGDMYGRYGGAGIGYPQCNDLVPANENGPQLSGFWHGEGYANYWMVVNPFLGSGDTTLHEVGHEEFGGSMKSMYRGETESIVHVLYTFASNEVYGDSIDAAFSNSITPKFFCRGTDPIVGCTNYENNPNRLPVMSVDDAARDWMVRENFRLGLEMDDTNTEKNEIRYQHRGHAKYADMSRLFGWQFMKDFHLQESLDVESGTPSTPCPNLLDSDDRTFRLSLKAGVDLTSLIHFWGIQPIDEIALASCMTQNDIPSSPDIKAQLERYATLVPMDQAAFIAQYDAIWPGKRGDPDGNANYGWGWYEANYDLWTGDLAAQTVNAVQAIIGKYYPTAPCEDISSASFCERKKEKGQCPHESCKKTCGSCGVVSTPAPVATPQPGTPAPVGTPQCSSTECCFYTGGKKDCEGALSGSSCDWSQGNCIPIGTRRMRGYDVAAHGPTVDDRKLNVFDLPHMAQERSNWNAALNRWNSKSLSQSSYEFEIGYDEGLLFALGPFLVEVDRGDIVSVRHKESGELVDAGYTPDIPSLDGIFGVIGRGLEKAKYVKVDYSESGVPSMIFVYEEDDDYEAGARFIMVRNVVLHE